MKLAPVLVVFAALIGGCATSRGGNGPYSPSTGSLYERQVVGALGEIEIAPAQRQAVLTAYDVMAPQLKANDAADLRLQRDWESLDPRSTDYQVEVNRLADAAAALASERLRVLAQFNQNVAKTLDASQWSAWSRVMSDQRAAFEDGRRLDPTFRPGERQ